MSLEKCYTSLLLAHRLLKRATNNLGRNNKRALQRMLEQSVALDSAVVALETYTSRDEDNCEDHDDEEVEEVILPLGHDEIDISGAAIAGNSAANVHTWPITARLEQISVTQNSITQRHTGNWPLVRTYKENGDIRNVEGNVWVGYELPEGQLCFATYEWIAPNEGEGRIKTLGAQSPLGKDLGYELGIGERLTSHIKNSPMKDSPPLKGQIVYFFSSSIARNGQRSEINQRTQVGSVIWAF